MPVESEPQQYRQEVPKLFEPLQIRSLQLRNRIVVSPMGMYSSTDGHFTDFHVMHHGHFAFRGASLTMVEATAVMPTGRTSPKDAGAWSDAHIEGMKKMVEFVHSLEGGDAKIAIQLAHSGRKGSMMPLYPGEATRVAKDKDGGWEGEVWGPSAIPFMENYVTPKEMTIEEIKTVVNAFGDAAERCAKAGFDAIEIHAAHGYLLSSFLSPCSNRRTDGYGGSFENRIRFLLEVIQGIRGRIPDSIPLFVRISATDWMEHAPEEPQWTIDDSIQLSLILDDHEVDLVDVSSASNNAAQKIPLHDAYYQIDLAGRIKTALKMQGRDMLVAAVGNINNATIAEEVLRGGKADVAFVATQFLKTPNLVFQWAEELEADMNWPRQYVRAARKSKMGTL